MLRANLAVVAHIRHVYTNYDELLKVAGIARSDARRGIEQFTLNKLVSWRGDDDDDDDTMIEDVLREVIVISDDEDESDEEDTFAMRKSSTRNGRVGDFSSDAFSTTDIDLTISDDEDESEDEGTSPYRGPVRPLSVPANPYDHEREARIEYERHSRWEQAVNRHRHDPVPADNRDVYNAKLEESDKHYLSPSTLTSKPKPIPGLDNYNRSITGASQTSASHPDRDTSTAFARPMISVSTVPALFQCPKA